MNIVLRELRANLKALIIWSICILLFVFMEMSEFAAYANNPEMAAILDSFPEPLMKAFGLEAANLTTVSGYYSILFTYNALIIGIHAVLLGSGIISKEERDKTVEFSCTLPISRKRLMTGKLIAAFINCIGVLIALGIASVGATAKYKPDADFYKFLLITLVAVFIIQMIFLAIGLFLASVLKWYKRSGSISVSILLVTYFMYIISGFSDKLDFLKYITPFKYFNTVDMLNTLKIESVYVFISIGIVFVCFVGAYVAYSKRDLHI